MDYQSRFNAIRGDMADEASMLEWQADEDFQKWLHNGPLVIDRHTVKRTGPRRATVTEPDGTVFENIIFGPTCPDNLEAMLAWHRKGKPKDVLQITDREMILALTKRVEALEAARSKPADMFDAADLADLIREDEPHAEAQRRWRLQYTQLNNRLVDTRLPPLTDSERVLLNRLQRALYAGRHGAVETI